MVLKTVSAANEVPGYTQLQQQISMTHYAHNTPNGFSPTVILQPATPTSGGLLSFCGFTREIR
jgi:hypothetical protein